LKPEAEKNMHNLALIVAVGGFLIMAVPAIAQTGPVATACAADIPQFCAGKGHGNRQTRSCLEANREKLSQRCRSALDSTGGGRRKSPPK
jgi:hypothetical protein